MVVFNPCGHMTSEEAAAKWSKIELPDNSPPNSRFRPICPFCARALRGTAPSSTSNERPYNRIIFCDELNDGVGDDAGSDDESMFADQSIPSITNVKSHTHFSGSGSGSGPREGGDAYGASYANEVAESKEEDTRAEGARRHTPSTDGGVSDYHSATDVSEGKS
mmetsp:Transcript_23755/g.63923  ORF Transcript_23755/g.63923 Transcript_23755/m.63923 type:complete len:164 (+) Transcript_23755:2041-2532(+)